MLLKEKISDSSLKTLIKNKILIEWEIIVSRFEKQEKTHNESISLSDVQVDTINNIKSRFEKHQSVLLHGATGSGKTDIYISLIEEQLKEGQVRGYGSTRIEEEHKGWSQEERYGEHTLDEEHWTHKDHQHR